LGPASGLPELDPDPVVAPLADVVPLTEDPLNEGDPLAPVELPLLDVLLPEAGLPEPVDPLLVGLPLVLPLVKLPLDVPSGLPVLVWLVVPVPFMVPDPATSPLDIPDKSGCPDVTLGLPEVAGEPLDAGPPAEASLEYVMFSIPARSSHPPKARGTMMSAAPRGDFKSRTTYHYTRVSVFPATARGGTTKCQVRGPRIARTLYDAVGDPRARYAFLAAARASRAIAVRLSA
jgi:hypothetical protein